MHGWSACRYEELICAKRLGKSIYTVRVAPNVKEVAVDSLLANLQGSSWPFTANEDMPPVSVITDIVQLLQAQGVCSDACQEASVVKRPPHLVCVVHLSLRRCLRGGLSVWHARET